MEHSIGPIEDEYGKPVKYYENGEHVRTTYTEGERIGEILYYENGEHLRSEYVSGDCDHGRIDHFEGGHHVRSTFAEGHPQHGEIHHFDPEQYNGRMAVKIERPVIRKELAAGAAKKRKVAGEFEGDRMLDYEEVKRLCLPPSGMHYGEPFPTHRKAVRVLQPPPKIFYIDNSSCAIDSFNMGVGETVLSRELFRLDASTLSSSSGASHMGAPLGTCREGPATSEAVKLDDNRGISVLKALGFALDLIGGKKKPPRLQQILKQKGGVFLFEFHWRRSNGECGHHVIAINCDLRFVFCNTLGALPFTLGADDRFNARETPATHDNVAKHFRIANVIRVWRILKV